MVGMCNLQEAAKQDRLATLRHREAIVRSHDTVTVAFDDYRAGDWYWSNDGRMFRWNGRHYEDMGWMNLDLSSLSQYLNRGEVESDCICEHGHGAHGFWHYSHCPMMVRMYGWPIDDEKPEPPKSPQDKALDDFIAKRKAKRDSNHLVVEPTKAQQDAAQARREKREEDAKALDKAMSKLAPHEQTIGQRLAPYRGPNV